MMITARRALGGLALSLLMATAHAQSAPSDAPPAGADRPAAARGELPPPPAGAMREHGGPGPRGPAFEVIRNIEEIADLYRVGGHPENVLPFLRETLAQTHDPMVRQHVRQAIVAEQLKPADTSAAIATLREQLREDLTAMNAAPQGKRK